MLAVPLVVSVSLVSSLRNHGPCSRLAILECGHVLLLNLPAVMITDFEYPYRPAFSLLTKLLDENASLLQQLPNPSAAPSLAAASASAFGGNPSQNAAGGLPPAQKGKLEGTLASYLAKYQDPKQADTIMKVQAELDETKIVLVR